MIDSVVTTIDVFDTVTVKRRSDGRINISMRGMGSQSIPAEANNAYRAAELFRDRFSCGGADISVDKNIPVGAGLGGSSADAAGVLNALSALYGVDDRPAVEALADLCGSDTRYMLGGGYARLRGRGNEIEQIESPLKLNFLILCPQTGVSTAECYARYDALPDGLRDNGDRAQFALEREDYGALCASFYNALYAPARQIAPCVEGALYDALRLSPDGAAMTGSGSAVFAVFSSAELCRWAQSRYRGQARAFCAATYIPKNIRRL